MAQKLTSPESFETPVTVYLSTRRSFLQPKPVLFEGKPNFFLNKYKREDFCMLMNVGLHTIWEYRGADKFLTGPGRKQANVSVRMAWISFGALPRRKKKTWWQLASRCCWNRARPWHASELVSLLVRLSTYQHPGTVCTGRLECALQVKVFWGTAPQGGRFWVRFPVGSLEFSSDLFLLSTFNSPGLTQTLTETSSKAKCWMSKYVKKPQTPHPLLASR